MSDSRQLDVKDGAFEIPISVIMSDRYGFAECMIRQLEYNKTEQTIKTVLNFIKTFNIDLNLDVMLHLSRYICVYNYAINRFDLQITERLLQVCPINSDSPAFCASAGKPEFLSLFKRYVKK